MKNNGLSQADFAGVGDGSPDGLVPRLAVLRVGVDDGDVILPAVALNFFSSSLYGLSNNILILLIFFSPTMKQSSLPAYFLLYALF